MSASQLPTSTHELIKSLEDYEDTVSWINDTLSAQSPIGLTELDQRITHLVATLDIACEDTSSDLERIVDDVSRGVPRLTYDLHFMKDSAVTLQSSLAKVHGQAKHAIQDSTSAALEKLRTLDIIKRNMDAAREVLREAESWSSLEMEVSTLLAEQNYVKAAERLSEANKSMAVFQNTPEYDPRRTLMVNLQNQLEASLSSALVSAISAQNLGTCRSFYGIFSQIERESEFRNYYNGSRRAALVTMWQDASLSDCGEINTGPQSLVEFLPKFYSDFLALLNQERNSIPSVFPDPPQSLSNLITSVFTSLQPSFPQRLTGFVSYHGSSALPQLIQLFKATEDFAHSTQKIFEKIRYSSLTSPSIPSEDFPPTTPSSESFHPKTHRRRSSRMSISWRQGRSNSSLSAPKLGIPDDLDWDQEVFSPFLQYQVDYGMLERRLLDELLQEIITSDAQDVLGSDQARLMRERAVDILSVAEESLGRCNSFTYGFASVGLVQAVDGLFQSFIDMWTADVSLSSTTSGYNPSVTSGDELSDLDYSPKDWADFQLLLHLLSSAHAVFERMTAFEIKLKSHLSQTSAKFKMAREDSEHFPIAPSKGESLLLEQSPLNSAELHALLEKVDPETKEAQSGAILRHGSGLVGQHPGGPAASLLSDARSSLFNFARTCQVSLQTTILSPLRKHLLVYPSSTSWGAPGDPKARTTVLGNDLQVPSFSLSPSEAVQRVGEGLINLPRLFETYADDDALSFSLHTLPHINDDMIKALSEQHPTTPEITPSSTSGASSHSHTRRTSIAKVPTPIAPAPLDPEAISSVWLASLGHTFLVHFTTDVLPKITRLTPSGAAQLASDLDYLEKISGALNVESEGLEKWVELVGLDDAEGKAKAQGGDGDGEVWRLVGRMRGWTR